MPERGLGIGGPALAGGRRGVRTSRRARPGRGHPGGWLRRRPAGRVPQPHRGGLAAAAARGKCHATAAAAPHLGHPAPTSRSRGRSRGPVQHQQYPQCRHRDKPGKSEAMTRIVHFLSQIERAAHRADGRIIPGSLDRTSFARPANGLAPWLDSLAAVVIRNDRQNREGQLKRQSSRSRYHNWAHRRRRCRRRRRFARRIPPQRGRR